MFHIVSKVFTFFIMPQGIICILLLYAIYTKNRTKSKRSIIAALIFFYLFSTPFFINEIATLHEAAPTPISSVKPHDIGIILTGGTVLNNKAPEENIFLGATSDRIAQALQLYKKGKIKKILLSGGELPIFGETKTREIDQMAKYLIISGVPAEVIYMEDRSTTTRENATKCAGILKKEFPNQSCLLITSAFHLKRAVKCFEKAGIHVTPYGSNYLSTERRWEIIDFIPSGSNMYIIQLIFREIIGYISYWVFGWV